MNERITELAEHCDFYIGNEHYDKSHEEKQRLFIEKFAELIVRECAGRVDWILAEGGKTQGDLIKQHFGVEE
jgi:hypothetical protein